MKNRKVVLISDKWSLEQLIDVQTRRTNERNRASIAKLEELNRKFEKMISKEKRNEPDGR